MQRANSSLFGLQLLGAGTPEVESLRSYVQRLAYAHHVSPRRLFPELLVMYPLDQVSLISVKNSLDDWAISGKGVVVDALLTRLQRATHRDLRPAVAQRFGHLFATQQFCRAPSQMHCPECVKEDAWDGLPYGRLLWELTPVTCCPTHRVKLVDSKRCGKGAASTFSQRPLLSGVCPDCGSIGYACRDERVEATDEEIWIAEQVGALVALTPDETAEFEPASVRAGIAATVRAEFGGELATAAVASGLGRTSVFAWVRKERLPSLDSLLKFCWRARADLLTLLHGTYQRNESAGGVLATSLAKRKYSQIALDWEQIRTMLIEEAKKTAPRAVEDVASELGTCSRNMRASLPVETERLAERSKQYQAAAYAQKSEELKSKLRAAANALLEEGQRVTKTNIMERSGIRIFNGRSRIRQAALREVLAENGITMTPVGASLLPTE